MRENKDIDPEELKKIEKKSIEPLAMEHIYFPLALLSVGLLLGAFCLLAEIIIQWFKARAVTVQQ